MRPAVPASKVIDITSALVYDTKQKPREAENDNRRK